MRPELLTLALVVGLTTWAFRVVPTKLRLSGTDPHSPLRRFFAATGPAAIATLFTAAILPLLHLPGSAGQPLSGHWAVGLGIAAVLAVYLWRRSVVLATLAGALAHGLAQAAGPW